VTGAAHCLQIAGLVIGFAGALLVTVTQQQGGISHGTGRGEAFQFIGEVL